ncbi:MAG: chemotaxis protein CheD [Opitutaceae bacterium]
MGTASVASIFAQRVIVGVGDMAISNHPHFVVSTYALGSCVAVVAYHAPLQVGGILHLMLPEAQISPAKAAVQPAMFADTGLPYFFRELGSFNVRPQAARLFLAGGASVMSGVDPFRIGDRNRAATLAYLTGLGLHPVGEDLGGVINRTLHLDISTGLLTVKTPLGRREFPLAGPERLSAQFRRIGADH